VYLQIKDQLEWPSAKNHCLSPMDQLLIALRYYASGTFQIVVGDGFGVDKATVCRTVHHVTRVIAALQPQYVRFPDTDQQLHDTMQLFYNRSGLPGIIGAVDCTHVSIQSPGGEDAEIYRNRKGRFSVNVQLVSDCTGYITNVVARWPGSVHDSTIFDNSHLRAKLESGQLKGYLVGDGGYACRRYLLTPVANPVNPAENAYNNAHAVARNCIERTNGILKRRFPALKYGMRLRVDNTLPVIVATVVLHNIAITAGDKEPEQDEQLVEFMASQRQAALADDYDVQDIQPPAAVNHPGAIGMRRTLIDNYF